MSAVLPSMKRYKSLKLRPVDSRDGSWEGGKKEAAETDWRSAHLQVPSLTLTPWLGDSQEILHCLAQIIISYLWNYVRVATQEYESHCPTLHQGPLLLLRAIK